MSSSMLSKVTKGSKRTFDGSESRSIYNALANRDTNVTHEVFGSETTATGENSQCFSAAVAVGTYTPKG